MRCIGSVTFFFSSMCPVYRNEIYLTHERWQHIIASINHPEMTNYEEHLKVTIRHGTRSQDSLNPQKYRYVTPLMTYQ